MVMAEISSWLIVLQFWVPKQVDQKILSIPAVYPSSILLLFRKYKNILYLCGNVTPKIPHSAVQWKDFQDLSCVELESKSFWPNTDQGTTEWRFSSWQFIFTFHSFIYIFKIIVIIQNPTLHTHHKHFLIYYFMNM